MYVDAIINKEQNQILVSERDKNGKRILVSHPTKYVVYWPNEKGKYTSIYGTKLEKFQTSKFKEFQQELRILPSSKLHESDINPIFRCLYDNYKDQPSPNLHIGFFDIETDFLIERGFSSPDDAFAPITAISVYLNWLEKNFTLVLKPKRMSHDAAQSIVSEFEDTILCDDEKQLLSVFLDLIEDTDILSGWNSEGFDIPYIHNRIVEVLGKDETRRLCLWGKYPRKREYEAYGRETTTYDLVGRVHLDYLQLYRKHTYHEMHSYRLDFVGEYEVKDKKTQYEGTLDQLYNNDFKKFIEYNRQDVMLLVKIDAKLKFIELASNIAHTNCVLLQTTTGAVALIDQAIVNAAHDIDLMVPTRIRETNEEKEVRWAEETEMGGSVVGAYVADPKQGMHDWIGGVDINSLYPSAIRALNMSPETIVGQIRPDITDKFIKNKVQQENKSFADAWNSVFGSLEYQAVMNKENTPLTIDFEDGSEAIVTAHEIYDLIFNSGKKLILSANGTIFDYSKPGLIPSVLARWYAERKALQAEYKKWDKIASETTDLVEKVEARKQAIFYDLRQLIKKILLNSLYGAIGNPGSRWFYPCIAQSTTLSGRCIVKHMGSKINEIITGEYNHTGKACIYGDSVTGDTKILTDDGEITIAEMFNKCLEHAVVDEKEYGLWPKHKVLGFNAYEDSAVIAEPSHVMRHKTKKKIYQIETENNKKVKVTEDHSIMIDRDGFLIEVKPIEILSTDMIITLLKMSHIKDSDIEIERTVIKSVTCLGEIDDYVYDLGILDNDPVFFANDCLVKNTDSIYFSAYPVMKNQEEFKDYEWNKENVIDLYDKIADITNGSFTEFMGHAFGCPPENGAIIKAARELCALKGLFITKKRYAVLIFDKDGKRKDKDGKPGEIKAMGLDLKRSDTPKSVQDFLSDVLIKVLTGSSESDIIQQIADFRMQFKNWDPWLKGSPKRANKITYYGNIQKQSDSATLNHKIVKKTMLPGHVLASLNWNKLKNIYNDHYSLGISDGAKVVVCKLKPNPSGITSVAYPVDQLTLPKWFKELPFDHDAMEMALIDKKLSNLLSVLNWNLNASKSDSSFDDLFSF